MDERELLRAQITSYEFYAGLIERAVGGGAQAKLPRWDEQRAMEYRALADQLRRRLAELEAQDQTPPQSQDQTPLQTPPKALPETTGSDEAQSIMVPSGDSSATPSR